MSKKYTEIRKKNTFLRNQEVLRAYEELYNQKRIRHDDCIRELAERFFLSERTISKILKNTSADEK